ncbi:MAG: isoleucine--tRNA ligase [Oscillospiraceae bacterium]|jgi:isoleucyl-tRNA synthetase|nr:isoleucine--tRNA ligase [Oscillospiraceae bacterium]
MPRDYNDTIRLPKTEFPMRASLAQREPAMLAKWQAERLYETLMEKNAGCPRYVLHDGPPFSNNDIHVGTAMNKILKDFVLRYKNMTGFQAHYVPGWDNHGLPIESQILKSGGVSRKEISVPAFRDKCRDFAMKYVERQRDQFVRLGILGDWDNPYLTMDPAFEAAETRIFGTMYEKGYIYRGLKPVYWCPHDETALAEAEIEYQDDPCDSIYVKFRVEDDRGLFKTPDGASPVFIVIWTTTTWTLPGNVAVSLHPRFDYGLYRVGGERFVVAEALFENVAAAAGWTGAEKLAVFKGAQLERVTTRHPFLDRESLVILGEHVTAESGTGCVHTAPGHGLEDYFACKPYDLPIPVPVDARGHLTDEAGPFAGLYYEKANAAILDDLRARGALLAVAPLTHTYPHCWRCKHPVVYRATQQWFASVDAMKADVLRTVRDVTWVPGWGAERMETMVRERADWCISRQRHWGLPIPVFYCAACAAPHITPESIGAVAALFAREGSNAWYIRPASEILPAGTVCAACGHTTFIKETDTLDGWFDSGSTHAAVLRTNPALTWPADLYLEGGDQYRGWFQSSLLTAVATSGQAPYRTVVTHGWTVDGEGRKMSKSLGNTVTPADIVGRYGADLLRLWTASSDYHNDMRISEALLRQLSEIYLKIRNTARFMLGNLHGFDPDTMMCPIEALTPLDRFVLSRLARLVQRVREAYDGFEYHPILHAMHNFCVNDLSGFYLDILKDRLYCDAEDAPARRAAQSTMYILLDTLVRLLAPLLAFTSEEIWAAMPHHAAADTRSVLCNPMPEPPPFVVMDDTEAVRWERIVALRDEVNLALEGARADKLIGKPLEAYVLLSSEGEEYAFWQSVRDLLPAVCIVSAVSVSQGARAIRVERAPGGKCPRCWGYFTEDGGHADHPGLCPRCTKVVAG